METLSLSLVAASVNGISSNGGLLVRSSISTDNAIVEQCAVIVALALFVYLQEMSTCKTDQWRYIEVDVGKDFHWKVSLSTSFIPQFPPKVSFEMYS